MIFKRKVSTSTSLDISEVGSVVFKKSARAKRLSITIRPSIGIQVTYPSFVKLSTAKEFVESKRGWIVSKMNELPKKQYITSGYKTREHEVKFISHTEEGYKASVKNGFINVQHPEGVDIQNEKVQELAKEAIETALRLEAKKLLPTRVEFLAQKHGFKYNDLRIKKTTSRWGSCSNVNNINLSIYLMKLPDELIDYVILHELCHTVHKNHGPNFWGLLNRVTGNAKGLAARVKKYRTRP